MSQQGIIQNIPCDKVDVEEGQVSHDTRSIVFDVTTRAAEEGARPTRVVAT